MIRFQNIILCVALLVGATALRADIVHTSADFLLGEVYQGTEEFDLDLNLDGTIDFSITASLNQFGGIAPTGQNQHLIHPSPPPNIGGYVAALDFDYLISSSSEGGSEEWFGITDNYGTMISTWDVGTVGEFHRHRGFVGLKFESADGTHYGWLDIEGVPNGGSYFFVHGWAYETTPDVGIVAGAVPEPSSVVLFTIGAIGIWTLRKRNNR